MGRKYPVFNMTLSALCTIWLVLALATPIDSGWNKIGSIEIMRIEDKIATVFSSSPLISVTAAVMSSTEIPTERNLAKQAVVEVVEESVLERPIIATQVQAIDRSTPRVPIDDIVPEPFRPLLLATAERFGMDPRMVAAVVVVESEWITRAKGKHNDEGLMQIIPETARWIAKSLGMSEYDLFDPGTNLTMGTWYLKVLFKEYGNWPQALAAYNGGPRAATLGADHPYSVRVMQAYGER